MKKTFAAALALVATAVLLAACGGSSHDSPTNADGSPAGLLDDEVMQPAPEDEQPLPVEPNGGIGTTPASSAAAARTVSTEAQATTA